jgi:molybdopterin/thiamine biosynthesis adenylyltransferase
VLSEPQIERYSRQIILPEVGSRGQERLLGATVSIHGGGDAATVSASYLAAAGVGRLWTGATPALPSPENPDSTRLSEPPREADVEVWIGDLPARRPETALVWGAASGSTFVTVRFVRDRACLDCLVASGLAPHPAPATATASVALGSMLALECLRVLLALGSAAPSEVLRADIMRSTFTTERLRTRPGCTVCDVSRGL